MCIRDRPTTLTYNPRLAKVKVDPRAKNQGQRSNASNRRVPTDKQTDRHTHVQTQTQTHTHTHTHTHIHGRYHYNRPCYTVDKNWCTLWVEGSPKVIGNIAISIRLSWKLAASILHRFRVIARFSSNVAHFNPPHLYLSLPRG